ncbi:hypothetical protein T439DRAFT_89761 [Meredithblackwellia eburnea MCA 4105]
MSLTSSPIMSSQAKLNSSPSPPAPIVSQIPSASTSVATPPPPPTPPVSTSSVATPTFAPLPSNSNSASGTPVPSTPRLSNTTRRLNALPRLLSSDGYGGRSLSAATASTTTVDDEETEDDEEDEQIDETTEDDDDDSEDFASADDQDEAAGQASIAATVARATTVLRPLGTTASISSIGSSNTVQPSSAASTGAVAPTTSIAAPTIPAAPLSLHVVPSNWVTFDPFTPTPGPLRTTRPEEAPVASSSSGGTGRAATTSENGNASYFDLQPRSRTQTASTVTSGGGAPAPMMSPLLPMSLGQASRGKRPTRQDEATSRPNTAGSSTSGLLAVPPQTSAASPAAGAETSGLGNLEGYRRRSHSAVLLSPGLGIGGGDKETENEAVGTAALVGLDPIWRTGVPIAQQTPGPAFLTTPGLRSTPAGDKGKTTPALQASSPAPGLLSPALSTHVLGRRSSMYELHDVPPMYHAVYTRPDQRKKQIVYPREEEGKEGLPGYTCAVHFEAYMPRKMEFTAPTVQAKDRAWKRQYIVIHGTAIKVYKFDLRTHPIEGEEDWADASTDMAGTSGPPPLHFHVGEYGSQDDSSNAKKFPTSMNDAKAIARSRLERAAATGQNQLVRHYSLQNAESGLAADYLKRKHAVRVRCEGEQFLLQAKSDRGVIDLIEAIQAATNVSLDLDSRLPPRFITLPRRRRRRRRPVDPNAPTSTGEGGTPREERDPNREPTPPDDSRLGDMLDEEQVSLNL